MTIEITTLCDGTQMTSVTTRSLCIDAEGDAPGGDVIGHIGGMARLPVGMEMPVLALTGGRTETLSHIASFSTSVLGDVEPALPAGRLVLLFAATEQPWSYLVHGRSGEITGTSGLESIRNGHRVLFVPEGADTVEIAGGTTYPVRQVTAIEYVQMKLPEGVDIMAISDDACDEWDTLNETLKMAACGDLDPIIRITGPVEPVQGDMEDQLPEMGRIVHAMDSVEADWICIAAVESLDMRMAGVLVPDSWLWGDCGLIYYWMTRQDLAAARFDRTICILQCS